MVSRQSEEKEAKETKEKTGLVVGTVLGSREMLAFGRGMVSRQFEQKQAKEAKGENRVWLLWQF
jgi:hypothetical protein